MAIIKLINHPIMFKWLLYSVFTLLLFEVLVNTHKHLNVYTQAGKNYWRWLSASVLHTGTYVAHTAINECICIILHVQMCMFRGRSQVLHLPCLLDMQLITLYVCRAL